MSQHDYNIENQTAINFRTDLNNALAAIATNNSDGIAPSTTYPNMFWYDTSNNLLKIRNEGNTSWIIIGEVNQGSNIFQPYVNNKKISDFLDEDGFESNSSTGVPTQQSVKAYVDGKVGDTVFRIGSGVSSSDGEQVFTFDTPFDNECLHVSITRTDAQASSILPVSDMTESNFTIDRDVGINGSAAFTYIAYGN
jgi:hypothetical protein